MPKQVCWLFRLLLLLSALLAPAPVMAQIFPLPAAPAPAASDTEASPDSQAALQNLIEVLKDDTARQKLIDQLQGEVDAAGAVPADDGATPATPPSPESASFTDNALSFGGMIGDFTQQAADGAATTVSNLWDQLRRVPRVFGSLLRGDYSSLVPTLLDLLALVVATYGFFVIERLATGRLRHSLRLKGVHSGWFSAAIAVIVLLAINLLLVIVAWAFGHIVALALFGETGRIAFHHTLFLNAFFVAEAVQVIVRVILSPRRSELRLWAMPDQSAQMLTRWFRLVGTELAFGILLVVPLLTRYVAFGAGRAAGALVYLIALGLVLNIILRTRRAVTATLVRVTGNSRDQMLRFLARYWHVPVILYVLVLMVVAVSRPERVLAGMLSGAMSAVIAIVVGSIVASLLTRVILNGIKLPPTVNERLPLLERRLNAFVPTALSVLRLVVVIAVAAFIINTLGIFDVSGWLESGIGLQMISALVTVALIAFFAFLAWLILNSWIDYRLEPRSRRSAAIKARERTLLILMRNALTITILVFAGMFILSEIGINIAPLLASAGVIGLAIGFGAQRLVQDIITGIFIQLEGAIDVGDGVTIGGISGSVERLTIRSAGLRDLYGNYHIVPFSSVTIVTNSNRDFSFAVFELAVDYRENIGEVHAAMVDAFNEVRADPDLGSDFMTQELEWMGIISFAANAFTVRARIKTRPSRQGGVVRVYNDTIKRIFAERGIRSPQPQQAIYLGADFIGPQLLGSTVEDGDPNPPAKPQLRRTARKPAEKDDS